MQVSKTQIEKIIEEVIDEVLNENPLKKLAKRKAGKAAGKLPGYSPGTKSGRLSAADALGVLPPASRPAGSAQDEVDGLITWVLGQYDVTMAMGKKGKKITDHKALTNFAKKAGATFKDVAYRGEGYSDWYSAADRLGLNMQEFFVGGKEGAAWQAYRRASHRERSSWINIAKDHALTPKLYPGDSPKLAGSAKSAGAQSFAKSAGAFTSGKQDSFAGADRFLSGEVQLMLVAKPQDFIDVAATIEKGSDITRKGIPQGDGGVTDISAKSVKDMLVNEQEVLAFGAPKVDVYIRFWPAAK